MMRLLLDTHIFLWLTLDDPRLGREARQTILAASQVFLSPVSIFEIAVKFRLGKIRIDPEDAIQERDACGFTEWPLTSRHAAQTARLPLLHRDPFDRLLVAQAICEPMRLLTADAKLAEYSELVIVI